LADAEPQTSFLKDLVIATNPTSPWSFLSYLVAHKRFYHFMNADFDATPRKEFAKYLAWTADGLRNLQFSSSVREVSFSRNQFDICTDAATYGSRHISLGIGLQLSIPKFADGLLGSRCFHSAQATQSLANGTAGRVVVIGGGQSGAEIVLHLLSRVRPPMQITWVSRRRISSRSMRRHLPTKSSRLAMSRASASLARSDGTPISNIKNLQATAFQNRRCERYIVGCTCCGISKTTILTSAFCPTGRLSRRIIGRTSSSS